MEYGSKIYLGNTEIVKSYIGSQQVDLYPQSGAGGTQYAIRTDPYASSLVLAMPMQLATNLGMSLYYDDISATIKGSGTNYQLVPTGSGILQTSGSNKFPSDGYQTSLYIGANGVNSQALGAITTTAANFGTSNFVIECWFNLPETSIGGAYQSNVFGDNSGDYLLADISTYGQSIRYYIAGAGGPVSFTWQANTWYHLAYVRSGNNFSSYINGTRYGSFSRTGTVPNAPDGFWRILGYPSSYYESVPKLVQDFKLYIGTDKGYTGSTITVPPSMIYAI